MPGTKSHITLRFMAAPMDANARGRVGAGRMLEWIDKSAYACAATWSGRYCVTAYVGNIHFTKPVAVGHIVEVQSRVVYTGRTSMHIVSTVLSGDPRDGELSVNTQCLLIFVAMDDEKHPTPVPAFEPRDQWEIDQRDRAITLIDVRRDIEADMKLQHYTGASESCRETLRFLAAPTTVNWGGNVHGGVVMQWIDESATLVGERWNGGPAVAVYAGGVRFHRPLHIGDLVEVHGRLIHTGTSSMHVAVRVHSGDPRTGEMHLTTECTMVLVGLDDDGHKHAVPSWRPVLPEDVALDEHAVKLVGIRKRLLRVVPEQAPPLPHPEG